MAACCQLPHSFQCTNQSLRLIVVSGFDYMQVLFYSSESGNLSPSGRAGTVQPLAHNKQTVHFPPPLLLRLSLTLLRNLCPYSWLSYTDQTKHRLYFIVFNTKREENEMAVPFYLHLLVRQVLCLKKENETFIWVHRILQFSEVSGKGLLPLLL